MFEEALMFTFQCVIFPGLLFTFIASFSTEWYARKLYARIQNRVGPKYTGPFGLLQPFADFIKLFVVKEDIRAKGSIGLLPPIALTLGIGSLIALLLMTPVAPFLQIMAEGDIILAVYLLLWVTLSVVLTGMATPNPFNIIGTSRFLSLVVAYEPTFLLSILTPIILASRLFNTDFSLFKSIMVSPNVWSHSPTAFILMSVALGLSIFSLQCKLMFKPFDIPDAETEIIVGPFTDYTGPTLALIIFLHNAELFVLSTLIVYLFLGGGYPFTGLSALLLIVIKYLLVVFLMVVIKSVVARLKIDQAIGLFWKYLIPLAMVITIFAILLPL
ncbi:MAG: NADH-quinone oxidoreductase subunit H [Nitrososphaerales archaeon]|nr:NADH-quinone oxidoreductase subunit H [Nitrososphaerales archaeon]